MKELKKNYWEIETERNREYLIPLGDIHFGHRCCEYDNLQGDIDYILDHEFYWLGMGDYIEFSTKQLRHEGVYDQIMNPQEQLEKIIELFDPIKHLCLGLHIGNHEWRMMNLTGVNPVYFMSSALGTRYLGWSIFNVIKIINRGLGNIFRYDIYSTHGSSAAKLPHTKIKNCIDLGRSFSADIYLYGHMHDIYIHTELKKYIDSRGYGLKTSKKYYCLTGGFLKYEGSYAERNNLIPSKTGVLRIELFADRWDIHISS